MLAPLLHTLGRDGGARLAWTLGGLVLAPVALALYPDDRPPPVLGWWALTPVVATGALSIVYPVLYAEGVGGPVQYLLLGVLLWWRHAHLAADDPDRRSVVWLALGLGAGGLAGTLAGFALAPAWAVAVVAVSVTVGIACLTIGLVAPDLGDVRSVTVTVAVHTVAGLVVVTVFSSVLAALDVAGAARTTSGGSLGVLAALLAVGYHPLATVLRGVVDLLIFGDRRDPLGTVSDLGDRLGEGPMEALASLRSSLALPHLALLDPAGAVLASSGDATTRVVQLALRPGEPDRGQLAVGLRVGEVALAARDRRVLEAVGGPLLQLLEARALGVALQESRTRVLLAVEEERRRIRRDLHDGLGPRLSGLAYTADAAANTLDAAAGDPAVVGALLDDLRTGSREAISDVRRLVDGLRPPALDQVGLVEAVRQHGQTLRGDGGRRMQVEVRAERALPPLEAAVEVAAYRIAVEALTNAARHSQGTRCEVVFRHDQGRLAVEVCDDGPTSERWHPGVGLGSMRERAEMLGGTFAAGAGVVRASLPV